MYLMVTMLESETMLHSNCKCFEAIVVTSLGLTQYTCRYMHNIIRPNTQPGIVTPTQERCGLEAQEAQLEKMGSGQGSGQGNGQGNGQHWLGHWLVKDK